MYTVYEIIGNISNTPLYQPIIRFPTLTEAQTFASVQAKRRIDKDNNISNIISEARYSKNYVFVGKRTDIMTTRYIPSGEFGGMLIEENQD